MTSRQGSCFRLDKKINDFVRAASNSFRRKGSTFGFSADASHTARSRQCGLLSKRGFQHRSSFSFVCRKRLSMSNLFPTNADNSPLIHPELQNHKSTSIAISHLSPGSSANEEALHFQRNTFAAGSRNPHLFTATHGYPKLRCAIDPARRWRSVANAEAVADAFYAHVVRRYAERF